MDAARDVGPPSDLGPADVGTDAAAPDGGVPDAGEALPWPDGPAACVAEGVVPATCRPCVEDACAAEVEHAFGSGGVCLALAACFEERGCGLDCVTTWIDDIPCRDAVLALSGCQESCVDACNLPVCGDGRLSGPEECDGELLRPGATCEELGFVRGDLRCGPDCRFDTSGCVPPRCGDGMVNGDEECEGSAFRDPGVTCRDHGFLRGEIGCTPDCHIDTGACDGCDATVCGGCCAGDRCYRGTEDARCGSSGVACEACRTGAVCRFLNPAWGCIAPLPDGEPCARDVECAGEVCSEGVCRSGCTATGNLCWPGDPACCRANATCFVIDHGDPLPVGSCCIPPGTAVDESECDHCCSELGGALGGCDRDGFGTVVCHTWE